jgi:cell division protein ZapA (FtsZ GTPase activity inhibitor)
MMQDNVVSVQLLGRNYQLKCLASESERLVEAANYLNKKMQVLNSNNVGYEKTAVLAGLDICCELLRLQATTAEQIQAVEQRLQHLSNKVEESVQQARVLTTAQSFGEQQQLEL